MQNCSIFNWALSPEELAEFGFSNLPLLCCTATEDVAKAYALDLEWVECVGGPCIVAAALVGKDQQFYWTLRPTEPVLDWLTHVTGMDSQSELSDMNKDQLVAEIAAIVREQDLLVGYALDSDLRMLGVQHAHMTDVRILFNHPDCPPFFYRLKDLALRHLGRQIQTGAHCPIEDARATLDLLDYSIKQGYQRPRWQKIGQVFEPSLELICGIFGEAMDSTKILNVYLRGSRACGTNRPDSDWDYVLVFEGLSVQSGSLWRHGNIDVAAYSLAEFSEHLRLNNIWALECLAFPSLLQRVELAPACSPSDLRDSIGYECGRKLSSAKRHLEFGLRTDCKGSQRKAKTHLFIALRFINLAAQFCSGKELSLAQSLPAWQRLLSCQARNWLELRAVVWEDYLASAGILNRAAPRRDRFQMHDGELRIVRATESRKPEQPDLPSLVRQGELQQHGVDLFCRGDLTLARASRRFKHNEVSLGCRGLVYDKHGEILAWPMNNFVEAQPEQTTLVYCLEKIDGSTAIVYWHGCWQVATNRNPTGGSVVGIRGRNRIVFCELFWQTFEAMGYHEDQLDEGKTYVFELVSPLHQIIIRYPRDELFLLAVRDRETGLEESVLQHAAFQHPPLASPKDYDKPNCEGVVEVFCDEHGRWSRVRRKSRWYQSLAKRFPLCSQPRDSMILDLILRDPGSTLLACDHVGERCEKLRLELGRLRCKLNALVSAARAAWQTLPELVKMLPSLPWLPKGLGCLALSCMKGQLDECLAQLNGRKTAQLAAHLAAQKPRIILLSGRRFAGKSHATRQLVLELRHRGFDAHQTSFSTSLKQTFCRLNGLDFAEFESVKDSHRDALTRLFETCNPAVFASEVRAASLQHEVTVVDDLRLAEHADLFAGKPGCILIRLEASDSLRLQRGWQPSAYDQHFCEMQLDGFERFDHCFDAQNFDALALLQQLGIV